MGAFSTAKVNAFLLKTFGEQGVLAAPNTTVTLTGLFHAPRRSLRMGGVEIAPEEPTFSLLIADWAAGQSDIGAGIGLSLSVRGRTFRIGRVLPDEGGLVALELQEIYV